MTYILLLYYQYPLFCTRHQICSLFCTINCPYLLWNEQYLQFCAHYQLVIYSALNDRNRLCFILLFWLTISLNLHSLVQYFACAMNCLYSVLKFVAWPLVHGIPIKLRKKNQTLLGRRSLKKAVLDFQNVKKDS